MSETPSSPSTCSPGRGSVRRGRLVAGGVLLAVALTALAAPYLPPGLAGRAFLPFLGVAFVIWAALARTSGLLVPGGVLIGTGVGLWLQTSFGPAAFLFSMAGGFLLISVLSWLIFGRNPRTWWTIFPAAGLAFAGLAVSGGPAMREFFQLMHHVWPYLLIVAALALIVSALRAPKE